VDVSKRFLGAFCFALPVSWLGSEALSPSAMPSKFEIDGSEGLLMSSCNVGAVLAAELCCGA
jgi:hypothetical protein